MEPPKSSSFGEFRITGPKTHKNLAVFLIHGEDRIPAKNILTLQEALEQKKAILHETGNVEELAIENLSEDEEIFIQAGDIVKGGKQDRTIPVDVVLAPRSGRVPIASFCVEQGRWCQREGEDATSFGFCGFSVASKELKLAAKHKGGQQAVWAGVEALQGKLEKNLNDSARNAASASSLQLTLEKGNVQEAIAETVKAFQGILEGKKDVIGFAFAINGEVNSAEVYGSGALFRKLWPKMLQASAVEALAKFQKGKAFSAPTIEQLKTCLSDAEKGKDSAKEVNTRTRLVTMESEENLLFETQDKKHKGGWVHRSYVKK
jgi:hypothetical protein